MQKKYIYTIYMHHQWKNTIYIIQSNLYIKDTKVNLTNLKGRK
jgi:hypothetical protein